MVIIVCELLLSRTFTYCFSSCLSHSGHNGKHHAHPRDEAYAFELPSEFDVGQELADSLDSLHQMRMVEERATPRNVTAQIGHPVYLHCIVEPIGDKMVRGRGRGLVQLPFAFYFASLALQVTSFCLVGVLMRTSHFLCLADGLFIVIE